MTLIEKRYGVWLGTRRVGILHQRGDYTWFTIENEYREDPSRPVLGLQFEEDLDARHASALRLPAWFSNLLPEGVLREWIADDRGVSVDREMELLAQVGHDLPGAVRVLPEGEAPDSGEWDPSLHVKPEEPAGQNHDWRFSLAGVALKFSMLSVGDRLTLPAYGDRGDWIVKLPDTTYPDVPRNEYAMMSLASAVGIDVPEVRLVHRDQVERLPEHIWPATEEWAYAIRRFDRDEDRNLIHIEDLAQVRGFYPHQKYRGNFETIASLIYRGRDRKALREFARRLAFSILISNGDAHLKNWSLVYFDQRVPTLAPAYDLVSTAGYRSDGAPEDLGLKFAGSKRFVNASIDAFDHLEEKLHAHGAFLSDVVAETINRVQSAWPGIAHHLSANPIIRRAVDRSIEAHSKTLSRRLK
ncbi:type II toxin-antitoxin system HipA family toxin [Herbidospora cretacea]|uniref:type II toxin-antitoxin system HipA family toxin n=1 Tax=Herbidospora cretacea TaxID=28444 RepID=UPI0009EEF809|nr:type II toxin-antitoxin system HipA family toxin [Herbidospora cretacea]